MYILFLVVIIFILKRMLRTLKLTSNKFITFEEKSLVYYNYNLKLIKLKLKSNLLYLELELYIFYNMRVNINTLY